ncbi:MAG: outer membrane protein OmpK, partial [Janthinobacterium lividum]
MKRARDAARPMPARIPAGLARKAAGTAVWSLCALATSPAWAAAPDSPGDPADTAPLPAGDIAGDASPRDVRAGPHVSPEARENPVGATAALPATAEPAVEDRPWLHHTVSVINSSLTRFGPYRTGNTYLEYEYFGTKGPFNLYGYVDVLKVFNAGTQHTSGIWDHGAPIFSEQEPRVALDTLAGKDFHFGPFKHIYLAADWIYEQGGSRSAQQNTLYTG